MADDDKVAVRNPFQTGADSGRLSSIPEGSRGSKLEGGRASGICRRFRQDGSFDAEWGTISARAEIGKERGKVVLNLIEGISPQLAEASNGVQLVIFTAMLAFLVLFLSRCVKELGALESYKLVEFRAACAAFVLIAGLNMRSSTLWFLRHADNVDVELPKILTSLSKWSVLLATVMVVAGGLCWIRTTMPIRCSHRIWLLVGAFAVIFGFGMAYVPLLFL